MKCNPNNPERWERIWDYSTERSPLKQRLCRSDEERIKKWDRMAKGFADRTRNGEAENRRKAVIKMLQDEGVLKPGSRVLDVGGGPGNWAVAMAEIADHVTVIEPSQAMVEILEKRIKEETIGNITVIRKRWEDLDIEVEGIAGLFDLVIASMTPGVNNRNTLEKLINASCGYCYMSGFSGSGRFQWFQDVWQLMFHESIGENPGDIIYPFNLLYAMGYRPKLNFTNWDMGDEMNVDDAVDFMLNFLWDYTDDTPEVREIITKYVTGRAESGIFHNKRTICQGHMLWEAA